MKSRDFLNIIVFLFSITYPGNMGKVFAGDLYCSNHHKAQSLFLFSNSQNHDPSMEGYDVKYYDINLEVSDTTTYLSGKVSIHAEVVADTLKRFAIQLSNTLSVDSVLINNESKTFEHSKENIIVDEKFLFNRGEIFIADIYYHGEGESSNWISGIRNRKDNEWDTQVTWTLSEPFGAKDWLPAKQSLADKIDSVTINLTTAPNLKAGSNGLLTRVDTLPDGKLTYKWKTNYPIAYYLISISVANYDEYNLFVSLPESGDSMLIQNYIYRDSKFLENNKKDIDITADLIKLFSELYGTYPFFNEKYGHCLAPMGGGMEHQTMTTLSNMNFTLVAHELGHQWFGDNVTCGTWQDIWINEGFASYTEYLALQYLFSQEDAKEWMQEAHNIIFSAADGSVYIPEDEASDEFRIFSQRLSYKKGAAIIHMLRHEIDNDEIFFEILRTFQNQFKDSTATGNDFKEVVEEITEADYTFFFDQWYYGEGYPFFDFLWKQEGDTLILHSLQQASSDKTPFFKMAVEVTIQSDTGPFTYRFEQLQNHQVEKIPVQGTVNKIIADEQHWMLSKTQNISKLLDEELNDFYFQADPNPFRNRIMLTLNSPLPHEIMVIDTVGKIWGQYTSDDTKFRINTSSMEEGIYFIIVKRDNKKYARKVIKH